MRLYEATLKLAQTEVDYSEAVGTCAHTDALSAGVCKSRAERLKSAEDTIRKYIKDTQLCSMPAVSGSERAYKAAYC